MLKKFVSEKVRSSTMHSVIIMTLNKSYSDNPTQCIYAVSKCFCTASSQDSLCHLVAVLCSCCANIHVVKFNWYGTEGRSGTFCWHPLPQTRVSAPKTFVYAPCKL